MWKDFLFLENFVFKEEKKELYVFNKMIIIVILGLYFLFWF